MPSFHPPDPNLIVSALRLLLESYKIYRSRGGSKSREKEEEVLEETVAKAEEMSAGGAGGDEVASEIETRLEQGLGAAAKTEIIARASSILRLAQPFELEAFRYYENLAQMLKRAQDFCKTANIFQLRGATNGEFSVLHMSRLGATLAEVCEQYSFLTSGLERYDVIQAKATGFATFLTTRPDAIHVNLEIELKRAEPIGGTSTDRMTAELSLSAGSEVNRIGFTAKRPESLSFQNFEARLLRDFEVRLTGGQFKQIISALLDDLNSYSDELAAEQREFKEKVEPQLNAILKVWAKAGGL